VICGVLTCAIANNLDRPSRSFLSFEGWGGGGEEEQHQLSL